MGWADDIAAELEDRRNPVPSEHERKISFSADALEKVLMGGPEAIPDSTSQEYTPPSTFDKYVKGPAEAALSAGTGMIAGPVGAVAGIYKGFTGGKYGTPEGVREAQRYAEEVADSITYRPRSQGGKEAVEALSKAVDESKIAGLPPAEMNTLASISAGPRARPVVAPTQQPARFGSVGSAAVGTAEQAQATVGKSSPEIQQAVAKAGPRIDLDALGRHVEADSLPVPVRLIKGQATQDVAALSNEQNLRAKYPEIAKRFNEQNQALIDNTTAIKEAAAPDVFATTNVEHGDAMIHAYRAKDAALNSEISKRYKALTDANGGSFPLDGKSFVDAADEALHKQLLFDHVPSELRRTMDRLGEGASMTFENFESLRTNLARIQRSPTADGNAKAAAGIVRQTLEEMPMPPGAEHLKPLADAARQAARERFALIEADPAYKAVVSGRASADKFIDKYVIGSDLKYVQMMKQNLADNPLALQTMRAGTINRLKTSAGIIDDAGNFSQAGYNKALENIRPKLGVLFDTEHKQQLETLGRVARYTQAQPRGSFVNTSNTATVLAKEHAKDIAEKGANVAFGGLPVGTKVREIGANYMKQRAVNEALRPGAGIRLRDVGK